MLNNLTNFFNIITNKMIKKVPEANDLIPLGTRDSRYGGKYKPTAITVQDFINSISSEGAVTLTKAELDILILSNSLVLGQSYLITNADPTLYGGTSILVQAISTNKLSLAGEGIFYTPKYTTENSRGIWDLVPYLFDIESFNYGADITFSGTVTQDSTTGNGTGFSATVDISDGYFTVNPNIVTYGQGYVSGDLVTILGSQIGGIDGVDDLVFNISNAVDYQIGGVTFWGGRAWTNLTGLIGASINKYTLNSDWEIIPFNTTNYKISVDAIHYDYSNDRIIKREDRLGNVVSTNNDNINNLIGNNSHPIRDFQWGNKGTNLGIGYEYGCVGNKVIDSLFECINFRVSRCSFNTITAGSSVVDNTIFNNFYKNSIESGGVINNTTGNFSNNKVFNSYILDNIFSSQFSSIRDNNLSVNSGFYGNISILGSGISGNILTSSCYIESNTGSTLSIQDNQLTLKSSISYNAIDYGYIDANFLNGSQIQYTNISNGIGIAGNQFIKAAFSSIIFSQALERLIVNHAYISNADLSLATVIYSQYTKTISINEAGENKLSYINAANVLIITDITA
jgi:hypothetical protein